DNVNSNAGAIGPAEPSPRRHAPPARVGSPPLGGGTRVRNARGIAGGSPAGASRSARGERKKIEGVRAPSIHIHGNASYFLGYLLEGVGRGHLGERHETGAADPG